MTPGTKFLIGLAGVSGLGILYHGPAGAGERFARAVEASANAGVANTGLSGISVSLGRGPLSRIATISGEADRFQREGMGSLPGINDIVEGAPGVSAIRWADEPARTGVPMLVETLIMLLAGYLAGFGLGKLLFGRRKRESFID